MANGWIRHRDHCTQPGRIHALVDLAYCPDCKALDTIAADAFRAGLDWLALRNAGSIEGIHFEEIADGKSSTGAPRSWALIFSVAITDALAPDDDGVRMLTITKAASGGHEVTCDHDLARREPTYEGEVCYHCVIEGAAEPSPRARPVLCARHAALEFPCPHCQGTGADHQCPFCLGSGTIITDPILWAAELLALEFDRRAEAQGDFWLAYLIIATAEARKWDYSQWIECHEGLVMLSGHHAPWEGCSFVAHADAAIIGAIANQMRKEVRPDELTSATAALRS
jgi:hypothetical protein